jgi:hypothetical protein
MAAQPIGFPLAKLRQMKPTQLLNYFDRISGAPDAIRRLRQLILNWPYEERLFRKTQRKNPPPSY